jgi:chemotaxis family two-component system response regulator Rcp1
MTATVAPRPVEMLLVEDDPGDVRLLVEVMRRSQFHVHLSVAQDGKEALAFLRREGSHADAPCPDLVLLDLNLPRMDGRELLAVMKSDPALKHLPVVILTTSEREEDVVSCYRAHANCYITKPVTLPQFIRVVCSLNDFWLTVVRLPHR